MIRKLSKLLGIALTITLLASLLSIAAPVSAASVEQPTVTTATTDISKATYYTIRFKVNKSLTGNATDKITIVFPSDTSLNAAKIAANTTVSASPGWFGVKFLDSNTAGVTVAADAMTRKITVTFNAATDKVGEGAEIRLQIDGITNPSEIDSYVLTVATSQETTAAESAPYDIKAPYIKPSAGTVEVFNSAGIRVFSDVGNAALQAGLNAASGRNYKVTVGPGTYTVNPVVKAGVTIESSSTAADTIIKGEWTVNETDTIFKTATVIKNLTLQANGKKVMWFGSDFAKVENCILKKKSVIVPN
ncbi:MAG: hypothetical protein JW712_09425, partial [Dehalococcoidales bacterium]|nr:hypothetical protein [Dehalococcoidales bacterium]